MSQVISFCTRLSALWAKLLHYGMISTFLDLIRLPPSDPPLAAVSASDRRHTPHGHTWPERLRPRTMQHAF